MTSLRLSYIKTVFLSGEAINKDNSYICYIISRLNRISDNIGQTKQRLKRICADNKLAFVTRSLRLCYFKLTCNGYFDKIGLP